MFIQYLCAWKNCLYYSLLSRLWWGPLSSYSGGRGCSDTVPWAELLFPVGKLCHISLSYTTGSEKEASTCRCLWVIILGFKALYESQDGDKKTVIFCVSLSVAGSQMYPFFFFLQMHILWWWGKFSWKLVVSLMWQAEFWAKLENRA